MKAMPGRRRWRHLRVAAPESKPYLATRTAYLRQAGVKTSYNFIVDAPLTYLAHLFRLSSRTARLTLGGGIHHRVASARLSCIGHQCEISAAGQREIVSAGGSAAAYVW